MEYFVDREFVKVDQLPKGEYEACVFSSCNFSGKDLSSYKFIECVFKECNLSNMKLFKTGIQEAQFHGCKMIGLHFDLCNQFNFSIECISCQLDQSVFYNVDLRKSTFISSKLQEVDMSEANLASATMTNCDLLNAHFEQTDLRGADLTASFNYSLDPANNKVTNAIFSREGIEGLLEKYKIRIV